MVLPMWIEKFEWACQTHSTGDAQMSAVTGTLLEGAAFRVYRDIPTTTRSDWTTVKEELLRVFPKTKPSLRQARAKWDDLQTKTFKTYEQMASKIQQRARAAYPGFPEKDLETEKKTMSIKGAKSKEARNLLISKEKTSTFAELVEDASRMDTTIKVCDHFTPGEKSDQTRQKATDSSPSDEEHGERRNKHG